MNTESDAFIMKTKAVFFLSKPDETDGQWKCWNRNNTEIIFSFRHEILYQCAMFILQWHVIDGFMISVMCDMNAVKPAECLTAEVNAVIQ